MSFILMWLVEHSRRFVTHNVQAMQTLDKSRSLLKIQRSEFLELMETWTDS